MILDYLCQRILLAIIGDLGKENRAEYILIVTHKIRDNIMNTFSAFLEHVMKNFAASFPYGLSKTEVTRLTFLAWCMKEANTFDSTKES